jgi:hypothetical protein
LDLATSDRNSGTLCGGNLIDNDIVRRACDNNRTRPTVGGVEANSSEGIRLIDGNEGVGGCDNYHPLSSRYVCGDGDREIQLADSPGRQISTRRVLL